MPPRYQPTDSSQSPRFTGVRTFARCPLSDDWAGADVAVLGVPFDSAVSFRPGARYGPAAVREMSLMMRRWHPALEVDVFDTLSVIDGGDITTTPGNAERTAGQIAQALARCLTQARCRWSSGATTRSSWASCAPPRPARARGRRAARRPRRHLGRLLGGALHPRHAVSPRAGGGPHRPAPVAAGGMRGSLYAAADYEEPREWGFAIVPCEELRTWTPERYAGEVTARLGDGPAYMSFDVDVLDPAFAPGTGTPETAGLLPHEALAFLRALAGRRSSATTSSRCRRRMTPLVRSPRSTRPPSRSRCWP